MNNNLNTVTYKEQCIKPNSLDMIIPPESPQKKSDPFQINLQQIIIEEKIVSESEKIEVIEITNSKKFM